MSTLGGCLMLKTVIMIKILQHFYVTKFIQNSAPKPEVFRHVIDNSLINVFL